MPTPTIEQSLIEALYAKRFRAVLAEWTSKEGLPVEQAHYLQRITEGLDVFDRAMSEAAEAILSFLSPGDPELTVSLDPEGVDGRLTLSVSAKKVDQVIGKLEQEGFTQMFQMSTGGIAALKRTRRRVNLIAPEGPVTSVSVDWANRTGASLLPRRLSPALSDLQLVSLPTWAWWAYWCVKPIRVLGRSLGLRWASRSPGPYLATPLGLVASLFDLVDLSADDMLIDLGCGDGRVLVAAASSFGCNGRGIEMDAQLANLAEGNVAQAGLADRIRIEVGDFEDAELADADVVFAFLPIRHLATILGTVLDRMTPGARLIAHEQEGADPDPAPDCRLLLVNHTGITVAHVWTA